MGTGDPLGPAPVDWAPMLDRCVLLFAEGALGSLGGAAGSNMAPPTAPAAESVWLLLFVGLDLMAAAQEPHPTFADTVARRLPQYCENDRRGLGSPLRVAGLGVSAPQPPDV